MMQSPSRASTLNSFSNQRRALTPYASFSRAPEVFLLSIQIVLVLIFFMMNIMVPAILGSTLIVFHSFSLVHHSSWLTLVGLPVVDLIQIVSTIFYIIDITRQDVVHQHPSLQPFDKSTALTFLCPYTLVLFVSCIKSLIIVLRRTFPNIRPIFWRKKKPNVAVYSPGEGSSFVFYILN